MTRPGRGVGIPKESSPELPEFDETLRRPIHSHLGEENTVVANSIVPVSDGSLGKGWNGRTAIVCAACCVWAVMVAFLFRQAFFFDTAPGELGVSPTQLPRTPILDPGGQPLLVMFIHPNCPCTRSTFAELRELLDDTRGQLQAVAIFEYPGVDDAGREDRVHRDLAHRIPGLRIVSDVDGSITRRFDARTSGECMLYDANGSLRFHGGLTRTRGHEGASFGRYAILNVLKGRGDSVATCNAFGCPLRNAGKEAK